MRDNIAVCEKEKRNKKIIRSIHEINFIIVDIVEEHLDVMASSNIHFDFKKVGFFC